MQFEIFLFLVNSIEHVHLVERYHGFPGMWGVVLGTPGTEATPGNHGFQGM